MAWKLWKTVDTNPEAKIQKAKPVCDCRSSCSAVDVPEDDDDAVSFAPKEEVEEGDDDE
jgi:hypothetical protein